jgi:alpha-glucosidase
VSPNATHVDGTEEYDVHNLFGHQILNATYHALLEVFPGKRPFIIGRSTFAGTGKWAGHWGGDNASLFAYMYFSISQALNFALFGIPMFGVDTCGFNGNSDEELCNRWMQLSAFFPFYRNHNTLSADSQEAYVWESVAEASKEAMAIRYSLLPYMYTLFHLSHTTGSTVMRALSWEFPNDPSLAAIDHQFLLGPSLMITPVLGQGMTSRGGIFPGVGDGEKWYDWYTQEVVNAQPGVNLTIDAPLGHIPVYIRGGAVLPQQEALYTTAESRNSSWSLIAALDANGAATGQLYVDDGESIEPETDLFVDFTVSESSLYASGRGLYPDTNKLANITILGVQSAPSKVTLNGASIEGSAQVDYNSTSQVVCIKGLESLTEDGAWAKDWTLTWA